MQITRLTVAVPCLVALVSGCNTTHMHYQEGTYTATRIGFNAYQNPYEILAVAEAEARELCAKDGKRFQSLGSRLREGMPGFHPPRATLEFKCVSP
jgi:hypothetical protein